MPAKIGMRSAERGMRNRAGRAPVTIEAIRETWRIDDEWWREPVTRTYYEVLLEAGGRAVLFVDHATREWFLQIP